MNRDGPVSKTGIFHGIVPTMNETLSIDEAGRVVIPKAFREKLPLEPGTRLVAEIRGDRLELTQAPADARIEKRGKRRVIVGWDGFDAAKAVTEAREEHLDRLSEPSDE